MSAAFTTSGPSSGTADAVALDKLWLAGITGHPPQNMISKTALGAEETVRWEHTREAFEAVTGMQRAGYEIAAIETSVHAVDLFDWRPRFPVCVLFGHETDGLTPPVAALADTHVRIPMLGRKAIHSTSRAPEAWFFMSSCGNIARSKHSKRSLRRGNETCPARR